MRAHFTSQRCVSGMLTYPFSPFLLFKSQKPYTRLNLGQPTNLAHNVRCHISCTKLCIIRHASIFVVGAALHDESETNIS